MQARAWEGGKTQPIHSKDWLLQFRASLHGQMLQLQSVNLVQNHELSDSDYVSAVVAMLKMDPNRKVVCQHLARKTGKSRIMKNIHNMATRQKEASSKMVSRDFSVKE